MDNNITVIIPTYNESLNIKTLLDSIIHIRKGLKKAHLSILVVDDSSPDGTANIIKEYMRIHQDIYLLENKFNNGIGSAYLRGFDYAINNLQANILFEMDADHSHRAEDIIPMYEKIVEGYDMVIGSRYVDKSYISSDWPIYRLFNSKICNFVANYIAGLKTIKDCTSGFRAIKKEVIKNVNSKLIKVNRYSFQVVFLFYALKMKHKVCEVPIQFFNRKNGLSKMTIIDTLELIMYSIKLRLFD